MPRTQARLPEPSGVGYFVMLLAICTLIALNSAITTAAFYLLKEMGVLWLKEARVGQPLLFITPLVLLSLELWVISIVSRRWTKVKERDGN